MGVRDFPSCLMIKNPPSNAGQTGLITEQGTKSLSAVEQLSPRTTTTEPACLEPEHLTGEKPEHLSERSRQVNTYFFKKEERDMK